MIRWWVLYQAVYPICPWCNIQWCTRYHPAPHETVTTIIVIVIITPTTIIIIIVTSIIVMIMIILIMIILNGSELVGQDC